MIEYEQCHNHRIAVKVDTVLLGWIRKDIINDKYFYTEHSTGNRMSIYYNSLEEMKSFIEKEHNE